MTTLYLQDDPLSVALARDTLVQMAGGIWILDFFGERSMGVWESFVAYQMWLETHPAGDFEQFVLALNSSPTAYCV